MAASGGINFGECLRTAMDAARIAGRIQRECLWGSYGIEFKGDRNLVTEVDRRSEVAILEILGNAFPDCDYIAEESGEVSRGSRLRWIIDPLDGTTNYAHGFPWFCVSIALEMDGLVQLGLVYHPILDEMFSAVRGHGAELNGERICVSSRSSLESCLLATGFPYDRTAGNENNFDNFLRFQLEARAIRRAGSAALDLAYVAAGRFDGYWECKLNPWDTAAGELLVEEAGGRVTNHSGEPHLLSDHRILATNGIVHDKMLEILSLKDKAPSA
jgi:myo-inositol-1(or 4)-monophosphatase